MAGRVRRVHGSTNVNCMLEVELVQMNGRVYRILMNEKQKYESSRLALFPSVCLLALALRGFERSSCVCITLCAWGSHHGRGRSEAHPRPRRMPCRLGDKFINARVHTASQRLEV